MRQRQIDKIGNVTLRRKRYQMPHCVGYHRVTSIFKVASSRSRLNGTRKILFGLCSIILRSVSFDSSVEWETKV